MAKFDISPVNGGRDCNYEPAPRVRRSGPDPTRMRSQIGDPGQIRWGGWASWSAGLFTILVVASQAAADPRLIPDPPPRSGVPKVGSSGEGPSWNLDGLYLWLGPSGAASHVDATWDSTFGGELAVVRVRERMALGVIGGALGASIWTARGGGRIWLDAVAGTRIGGRIYGATLGPIVELSELAHPRPGAALGIWAFVGVTPFARIGIVDELGMFAEVGVHIALPVLRR
jgi:hypothetical protein